MHRKGAKWVFVLLAAGVLFAMASGVNAGIYTFVPNPADLWDLDHYYYISWGIGWSVPAEEEIVAASLTIKNINDWRIEDGDYLYIRLLDNPTLGVKQYSDSEKILDQWRWDPNDARYQVKPAFGKDRPLVGVYEDKNEYYDKKLKKWVNPAETITFNFDSNLISKLTSFASNGVFGFGFDPDCHYYNDGVEFKVTTAKTSRVIPEPMSIVLGVLGLGLVSGVRKLRGK